MPMKHLSDYHEAWDFSMRMSDRYGIDESLFRWVELDHWNITSIDLFTFPAEYRIWFNSTRGDIARHKYPICYFIAKNDVIPINIETSDVILPEKDKLYVDKAHGDMIAVVKNIVSDNQDIIIKHYYGYIEDIDITRAINKRSDCGWKYYVSFLDNHTPNPNMIHNYDILHYGG